MNPGRTSGPIWDRHDDNLLLSADPKVRQQLQDKYGEEALVKRILFLEVEGWTERRISLTQMEDRSDIHLIHSLMFFIVIPSRSH